MPNRESCTLEELETSARAAPIQRTNLRLLAIKALAMGIPHEQVAALFGVNEDSVSRWVRRFNQRGIDGLKVRDPVVPARSRQSKALHIGR